jgi:hypothetical protein
MILYSFWEYASVDFRHSICAGLSCDIGYVPGRIVFTHHGGFDIGETDSFSLFKI